jgi:hypothetical protein
MFYVTLISTGHTLQTISAHATLDGATTFVSALRSAQSDLSVSYSIDVETYGKWEA